MIIKVIIINLLLVNVCYSQELKIIPVSNLKTCRKDFSVNLCKLEPDTYQCFKFTKKNKEYLLWEEVFTNSRIRTLVQKINRRNSILWKNHCVAITSDLRKDELYYAPFKKEISDREKHIIIDLNILAFGAYKDGKLVFWGPANGGAGLCKETGKYTCKTPAGEHRVYEIKKGFQRSSLYPVECKNKKVCGHPYRDVQKFGPHFEAIHSERDGHILGANISHGCVRIMNRDGLFLINNFTEIGTKIVVIPY